MTFTQIVILVVIVVLAIVGLFALLHGGVLG